MVFLFSTVQLSQTYVCLMKLWTSLSCIKLRLHEKDVHVLSELLKVTNKCHNPIATEIRVYENYLQWHSS